MGDHILNSHDVSVSPQFYGLSGLKQNYRQAHQIPQQQQQHENQNKSTPISVCGYWLHWNILEPLVWDTVKGTLLLLISSLQLKVLLSFLCFVQILLIFGMRPQTFSTNITPNFIFGWHLLCFQEMSNIKAKLHA